MSVWYIAVCPERKEYFDPGTARDHQMLAASKGLMRLMLGDWLEYQVKMETDWSDDCTNITGWVNRYRRECDDCGRPLREDELRCHCENDE